MARARHIHNNFTAGELSPRLDGRTDLAKYYNGVKTLENFLIWPHGGVYRRYGTRYAAEVKDSSKKVRQVAFEFSTTQAYILEFGDLYHRVYRNSGQVVEAAKTITNITQADPAVVTSTSHGFSNGEEVAISGVVGMTEVNGRNFKVANVAANTFELQTMDGTDLDSTAFTAYSSGGTASRVYTLVTPYAEADLFDLQFAQSADVLYVAHRSYASRKITRTADDAWTITEIDFLDGPYLREQTTITITPSAVTGSVTLTASSALWQSDHVGSLWRIKHDITPGQPTVTPQGASGSTSYSYRITSVNSNGETLAGTAGTTNTGNATLSATNFNRVSWTAVPGAAAYRIYGRVGSKELFVAEVQATQYDDIGDITPNGPLPIVDRSEGHWGYVKITSFSSSTSVGATVKKDLGRTTASAAYREGAWSAVRGYPGSVALFEGRLFWSASPNNPQHVWGSQVDDFENMDEGTAEDDESLTYELNVNQVNVIRWLAPMSELQIGTVAREMRLMASGGVDEPLTPSNVKRKSETAHGSANIQPLQVGKATIFVQRAGRKLRELGLTVTPEGVETLQAPDLTILAEHLLPKGKTIVSLAYQQEPDSIVYAVRSDGVLLALTYQRDQDVIAWSRSILGGSFSTGQAVVESVATIPHPDGDRDQVWISVKRTINGATKRYIEYIEDGASEFTAREWAEFYLDSALPYSGASTTTITGLYYLEGETVKVVGDGAIYPDKVVSSGQITISPAASEVEVGLGYTSTLETMNPEIPAVGTILGRQQSWNEIKVQLLESLGLKIFGDVIPFRKSSDPMDSAPPLFTGFKRTSHVGIDKTGRITITQDQPLPLKILSISGELNVGDV